MAKGDGDMEKVRLNFSAPAPEPLHSSPSDPIDNSSDTLSSSSLFSRLLPRSPLFSRVLPVLPCSPLRSV